MLWFFPWFFPQSLYYLKMILPTLLTLYSSRCMFSIINKIFQSSVMSYFGRSHKEELFPSSLLILCYYHSICTVFHGYHSEAPFLGNFLCFLSGLPQNTCLWKNVICKKTSIQVSVSGVVPHSHFYLLHLSSAADFVLSCFMTLLICALLICAEEIQVSFVQALCYFNFFHQIYPSHGLLSPFWLFSSHSDTLHSICQLTRGMLSFAKCVSRKEDLLLSQGSDCSYQH